MFRQKGRVPFISSSMDSKGWGKNHWSWGRAKENRQSKMQSEKKRKKKNQN